MSPPYRIFGEMGYGELRPADFIAAAVAEGVMIPPIFLHSKVEFSFAPDLAPALSNAQVLCK
jgi:hypothetical protein